MLSGVHDRGGPYFAEGSGAMHTITRVVFATALWGAVMTRPARGAEFEQYHLRTTSDVTITLPVTKGTDRVAYRAASGEWKQAKGERQGGQLRLDIDVNDLKGGETFLVLHVPDWLNLNDNEPPRIIKLEIDGVATGAAKNLDLGWLAETPRTVALELEDKENPIDQDSLSVVVDGSTLTPNDPNVSFAAASKKRGRLTCQLSKLVKGDTAAHTVTMRADDFAVDDAALELSLTFRCCPWHRLPDGAIVRIDSLTSSSGWRNWSVLVDGKVMKAGDPTTAGHTWLSDKTEAPHWAQFEFPKARRVGRVDIWWAYWECYRTSTKYEVQTWDGKQWVTQAKVEGQAEKQCSTHTFTPVTTTKVRVWQPAGCGHPGRSDLMWMPELKAAEK